MSDAKTTANEKKNLADEALAEAEQSDQFAETLTSLERVIEHNANQLEQIKQELKERREMINNYFENDVQLQEVEDQLQLVQQSAKERKAKLQEEPQLVDLKIKVKELNEQKKEIEETLSNHLLNHFQMTNSTSFDTSEGDQWEYQVGAKVKARPRRLN